MKRFQTYLRAILALVLGTALGACTTDDTSRDAIRLETDATYYSANTRGLSYNGDEVVIRVRSNTYWVVTYDKDTSFGEPWFSLAKEAGDGDMDLVVTLQRNDGSARSAELKFVTNRQVSTAVTLSQAGTDEAVYFYGDDFGSAGAGTAATEFAGWNLHGMGIEETYYDARSVTVDAGSPSTTYDGASGGNNLLFDREGWLTVGGIATKGDYNFIFSFGVSNDLKAPAADELRLFISQDRAQWTPVEYAMPASADAAGKWSTVRIPFFIKENCPAVFFRFESTASGYRIDDPALEEGNGTGETITFVEDIVTYIKQILWEDDFSWANNAAYVKSDAWTGSDGTRIDKWSNYPASTNGWTIETGRATSYPRSAGSASTTGYLKSGWANGGAGLLSPRLEAIGNEARDVTVELTLSSWTLNNKPDNDRIRIRVVGGGTVGNASATEQEFNIGSWNEWSTHEFPIFGATASTQIYVGSIVENNNRWFIDRFRVIYTYEKPSDFRPELTLDAASLEFATSGGEKTVKVTANAEWTVYCEADWIGCKPETGDAGTCAVTVAADRNLTGAERRATLEFRIDDQTIATLEVVQPAKEIEYAPAPTGLELIEATATTLTIGWEEPAESSHKYRTAIFTDPDGQPIRISPDITRNAKFPAMRYTFGALAPSTTYHFAVQAISAVEEVEDSRWVFLESRTTAARTPAAEALAALYFDGLKWGGDHILLSYGARPKGAGAATAPDAAMNDLCNANTGGSADVFNTHSAAFRTDRGIDGWYGLRAYEFPGYLKLGTASAAGFIVTPKLEKLTGESDVRVTFRLGNWNEPNADGSAFTIDKAVVRVGIVPETVTDANLKSYANAYTMTQNLVFTQEACPVSATPQTWIDASFEVPGVKPTDRIIIYSTVDGTEKSGKARFEVDDIEVVPSATKPATVIFEDTFDWVVHNNDWVSKQAGFAANGWIAGENDTASGHDWRRVYAKDQCIQFGIGTYEGAITSRAMTELGDTPTAITVETELTGNASNKRSAYFEIVGTGSFAEDSTVKEHTVELDGYMPDANTTSGKGFTGWETHKLKIYGADRTTQLRIACVKIDGTTRQFWLNSFRVTK